VAFRDWGGRIRDRDGIPVGTELERIVQDVRSDPGPAPDVRTFTAFMLEASFSASLIFWPQAACAVVLSVPTAMVALGTTFFGVLDHGQ